MGKYHELQNPWVNTMGEYHNYNDKIKIIVPLIFHFNIMIYFIYYHVSSMVLKHWYIKIIINYGNYYPPWYENEQVK